MVTSGRGGRVFEGRESGDVFEGRESGDVFEGRESGDVWEGRESGDVFEGRGSDFFCVTVWLPEKTFVLLAHTPLADACEHYHLLLRRQTTNTHLH